MSGAVASSGMGRSAIVRSTRRRVRGLSVATARVSAPLRLLPDFLIVGAQRCGTTSLFKTLAQHPMVARPFLRKGIHYFDMNYDRRLRWYRGQFPIEATSRLRRLGRGRPRTGESSPYYLFHPLAGQRIAADLPGVRLIVLVRDPVERAYSAHSHELARGFETEDFERAIELEDDRLAGESERMLADPWYESHSWQHHAYLRRGCYIDQVTQLEELVGPDRLLVVDSHDFFIRPAETVPEVLDFLGLPLAAGITYEQHNARARPPLPAALRNRLDEHFRPYDEKLAAWWGRTPSWRR
jgi:hypothetical protein